MIPAMRFAALLSALALVSGMLLPTAPALGAPNDPAAASLARHAHDCCDQGQGASRGNRCARTQADARCMTMGCGGGVHGAVVISAPAGATVPSPATQPRTHRVEPVALGPPPPAPRAGCELYILYCRILS
jgi:hypothetical protein